MYTSSRARTHTYTYTHMHALARACTISTTTTTINNTTTTTITITPSQTRDTRQTESESDRGRDTEGEREKERYTHTYRDRPQRDRELIARRPSREISHGRETILNPSGRQIHHSILINTHRYKTQHSTQGLRGSQHARKRCHAQLSAGTDHVTCSWLWPCDTTLT